MMHKLWRALGLRQQIVEHLSIMITRWIRSNIALELGFSKVLGLEVILYSVSIRDFMKLWLINYDPWSCMIYIGLEYLDIHVFSTKFAIYLSLLSLYCAISNPPVTWSIIVTDFKCKFPFCLFLLVTQGLIIYTQSLFHGIYSDNVLLAIHHILYLIVFYVFKCPN